MELSSAKKLEKQTLGIYSNFVKSMALSLSNRFKLPNVVGKREHIVSVQNV
jgi:hypothetical protein